ncbi:AI-2E family transporter [Pseudonocardia endophytica]|uniref:Putative PurR-regulated permease PerM n=1 Tax=Pseudonocardia endophytica TaxID=401976 RepID=A0A4R1HWT4_PSEEN|nr:AI-2E family transporter [Pseudonocardia endophytica]TCK25535.1 putative PurR-regulated permease PerM [Pseudonocardia endophytica]
MDVRLPRSVTVFVVLGGMVITVLGLQLLAWLVVPAVFALVIVILVHPVHEALVRRRVPTAVALLALLLAIYGVILGLVAIVVYAMARLATVLPSYAEPAVRMVQDLAGRLGELGIGSEPIRDLYREVDLLTLASWLTARIPSVAGLVAALVLVYSLLLFMGIESTQIRHRSAALMSDHPRLAGALRGFVAGTRRYIAITGGFALVVGALDAVFLLIMGIPLAVLWGVLAAACNFVPYVGFLIGLAPPALLALLTQGWQSMLVVVVVYFVLNSIITTIIPAKVVGDAVGMSMTVTMASVAFWSWVLGPLGAVLAIPLSLLVKAVFVDGVPSARWLAGFVDSAGRGSGVTDQPEPVPVPEPEPGPEPLPEPTGQNESS